MTFTAYGVPKPQKRHRTVGGHRTYDPSAKDKKALLAQIIEHAPPQPLEGPIELEIDFYFPYPKTAIRKTKPNPDRNKHTRPDIDNLVKLVMDTMNGVFYRDDGQIAAIHAFKIETTRDPQTVIYIEEI